MSFLINFCEFHGKFKSTFFAFEQLENDMVLIEVFFRDTY